MNEESSFWDRLSGIAERAVGGYFDLQVAETELEAQRETRVAEEERASMIDQLSRALSLGQNTAQDALNNMPSWVVPAAVLGFGAIVLYRFAK